MTNAGNRKVADQMLSDLRQVPGLVDLRVQQPDDAPVFNVAVDRTKALEGGYTQRDIGTFRSQYLVRLFSVIPTVLPQSTQRLYLQHCCGDAAIYQIQSLQDLEKYSRYIIERDATGNSCRYCYSVARHGKAQSLVITTYGVRLIFMQMCRIEISALFPHR